LSGKDDSGKYLGYFPIPDNNREYHTNPVETATTFPFPRFLTFKNLRGNSSLKPDDLREILRKMAETENRPEKTSFSEKWNWTIKAIFFRLNGFYRPDLRKPNKPQPNSRIYLQQ